MFVDSWGNVYETKQEAHDALLEMFRADITGYRCSLNDFFRIEPKIWDFICEYAWDSFFKVFTQEIQKAEEEFVKNDMEDLEEE